MPLSKSTTTSTSNSNIEKDDQVLPPEPLEALSLATFRPKGTILSVDTTTTPDSKHTWIAVATNSYEIIVIEAFKKKKPGSSSSSSSPSRAKKQSTKSPATTSSSDLEFRRIAFHKPDKQYSRGIQFSDDSQLLAYCQSNGDCVVLKTPEWYRVHENANFDHLFQEKENNNSKEKKNKKEGEEEGENEEEKSSSEDSDSDDKQEEETLENMKARMSEKQTQVYKQLTDVLQLPDNDSAQAALLADSADTAANLILAGKLKDILEMEKKEKKEERDQKRKERREAKRIKKNKKKKENNDSTSNAISLTQTRQEEEEEGLLVLPTAKEEEKIFQTIVAKFSHEVYCCCLDWVHCFPSPSPSSSFSENNLCHVVISTSDDTIRVDRVLDSSSSSSSSSAGVVQGQGEHLAEIDCNKNLPSQDPRVPLSLKASQDPRHSTSKGVKFICGCESNGVAVYEYQHENNRSIVRINTFVGLTRDSAVAFSSKFVCFACKFDTYNMKQSTLSTTEEKDTFFFPKIDDNKSSKEKEEQGEDEKLVWNFCSSAFADEKSQKIPSIARKDPIFVFSTNTSKNNKNQQEGEQEEEEQERKEKKKEIFDLELVLNVDKHANAMTCQSISISSCNSLLAHCGQGGHVRVYDVAPNSRRRGHAILARNDSKLGEAWCCRFDKKGRFFVASGGAELAFYKVNTAERLWNERKVLVLMRYGKTKSETWRKCFEVYTNWVLCCQFVA